MTGLEKVTKDCVFVRENTDGSETWLGKVVTGKGDAKREVDCEFLVYPTLDIMVACLGADKALCQGNRQTKTDFYNDCRNGLNAVQTPQGAMREAYKQLASGKISKTEFLAMLAEALPDDASEASA